MGAPDTLGLLSARGLTLRPLPDGNLEVSPRSALTDELRATIRQHEAEPLTALVRADNAQSDAAAEFRRQRVLAKLAANRALRIAVVCDGEGDPVPVAVAIRNKGTCEVQIPSARFDPLALLELVGRHGGTLQ